MLLLAFAALAGALTALTPCVLPVLPALLSAAGTGGRRRPAGVVLGLVTTHFVVIVLLSSVVEGIGLADGATRTAAITVLLLAGLVVLVPAVAHRVERLLTPLGRLGPRRRGEGFASGLLVGGALGFVYAPCAGPILAAVITVGATRGAGGGVVLVAAAYSLGSGVSLLAIAQGGRRLVAGRGRAIQRGTGAVLVLTALAMAAGLDTRLQQSIATGLPAVVVNPTKGLEGTAAVQGGLDRLRGQARFAVAGGLADRGPAPELRGTQRWWNTAPTTLAGLRGKVVLVDFWTYSCINCLRSIPALRRLDERYRDDGLVVLGVHSPEFGFEKDAANVEEAVRRIGIRYPVVQDNEFATWDAFGTQSWPTSYLVDAKGRIRYVHRGEGGAAATEDAVRALLAEAGRAELDERRAATPAAAGPAAGLTPETYVGATRAAGFLPRAPRPGTQEYCAPRALGRGSFALDGRWAVDAESGRAVSRSRLLAHVRARQVYLVLGSEPGSSGRVQVRLDGRPVAAARGEDVDAGVVRVAGQRLYRLVALPGVRDMRLELRLAPGVRAYAFTFG